MKKNNLVVILLYMFINSCTFDKPMNDEIQDDKAYEKAYSIVHLIKDKKYNKIKESFIEEIKVSIPDSELRKYIDLGSEFIAEHGIPKQRFVHKRLMLQPGIKDTLKIIFLDFPFPEPKEEFDLSDHLISVGFAEGRGTNKIVSLQINKDVYQNPIKEPTISKLSSFSLNADNVIAYRVYYSGGAISQKLFGKNKGIFALQGQSDEFKQSKLKEITEQIFKQIEKSEIKSVEIFNQFIQTSGRPEFIQVEYMFSDKKYGIRLYSQLNQEEGLPEKYFDMIVLRQMEFTNLGYEYILSKRENQKIVQLLEQIRDIDWEDFYVENP